MEERRDADIASVAAMADPVRRRLYDFVAGQAGPVDRDGAAAGTGIGRSLAAFHLDRLAAAGLLDVEYHRRTGRSGPGAGRPAKFYRRPAREIGVSLPERHYELAADLLAEAVERRPDATAAVLEAARERGTKTAEGVPPGRAGRDALLGLLVAQGYEPLVEPDGVVRLRNCPFHALVDRHRPLTCSMNLAMLEAVAASVAGSGLTPVADPREGTCCVAFVPEP